jgi:hypothetical protein
MRKSVKAVLLALVVMAVAVPVVASMDRSDLAIDRRAPVSSETSAPLAYLVASPSGSDLLESGHLFLVGSVLIGLAAAVRRTT